MKEVINIDIDRKIFPCPEIDMENPDYYPIVSEGAGYNREDGELCRDTKFEGVCRAFVREKDDGSWFADVYFNNYYSRHMICSYRFIIEPGKVLPVRDEKLFIKLCNTCMYKYLGMEKFWEDVLDRYTLIGVFKDGNKDVKSIDDGAALVSLYYSSRRGGLRELAFKAGLVSLGCNISRLDEIDILATNIEDALSIPIKMLKKLEYSDAIDLFLINKESRDTIAAIYRKYHSQLNDVEYLGYYQVKYLQDCLNGLKVFDKKILKVFEKLEERAYDWETHEFVAGDNVYDMYFEYRASVLALNKEEDFFEHYPKLGDFEEHTFQEQYYQLKKYTSSGDEIDKKLIDIYEKNIDKYAYSNEQYQVILPRMYRDYVVEGNLQKNCVATYVDDVIDGKCIIAFVRENSHPDQSYITIEIKDDVIVQAKAYMNMDISTENRMFLDEYACHKGLRINVPLSENDNDLYEMLDISIELSNEAMNYFLKNYSDVADLID